MKLWSSCDEQMYEFVRTGRICPWATQLALLIVGLLGPFALQVQAHQDVQNKALADQLFMVSIADAQGGVIPDVSVDLMRDRKLLARMKTGADGRASVRVTRGILTVSIHQTGYLPVDQVVDTRSTSEVEVKLVPVPQAHETVNVHASNEDIAEQNSSPGASIKPEEANESPLRPLTLTDALPACSWSCACTKRSNPDRRIRRDA